MVPLHPAFDNRVTRDLGVEVPIVQAPMGWIARSRLASAVSRAGACGIIETSSGELDAENAAVVYELIGELARAQGTTAIVVSHDPGSASIADRIVHIRDGRVSAEQARAQLDDEEIVVARGGWLRVPEELLRRGGIGSRARARLAEHSVLIEGNEDVAEADA